MLAPDLLRIFQRQLWERPGEAVYAVIDGASCPALLDQLYGPNPPEFNCLYRGELAPDLAETAPYLARLEPGSAFADWLIGRGYGQHWNLFINTTADLRALTRHLRTLNIVHAEGRPLLFRYYDPRVLALVLPTFDAGQRRAFFGPVARFLAEEPARNALRSFALAVGGELVDSAQPLGGDGVPSPSGRGSG
jgi:hypothetical protein